MAFHSKPGSKRQSMEWKHKGYLVKEKLQVRRSVKQVKLTVFRNVKRPMTINFLEKGATVNNFFLLPTS